MAFSQTPPPLDLIRAIQGALEKAVAEEIEKEIGAAKARVEVAVRGRVASIAATILERFSYEKCGNDLTIKIENVFKQ